MMHRPAVLAASLLTVLAAGCHEQEDTLLDVPPAYCDRFSSTLTVLDSNEQPADTFVQGETITFELVVANNDSVAHALGFPDGCGQVRFEVEDASGALLWTSDDDRVCTQAAGSNDYDANSARIFRSEWDQIRRDGQQADIGDYRVLARDRSECAARLSTDAEFRIQ